MSKITVNEALVSYCGLYCGSCKKYINASCPSCANNEKATWCKTRTCNISKNYKSCADCSVADLRSCRTQHNFISKAFGLVFNTDRVAGLELIRAKGYTAFAQQMADTGHMSLKRRK